MNQLVGLGVVGVILGLLIVLGNQTSDSPAHEVETPYERSVRARRRADRMFLGPVMIAVGLAVLIVGAFFVR